MGDCRQQNRIRRMLLNLVGGGGWLVKNMLVGVPLRRRLPVGLHRYEVTDRFEPQISKTCLSAKENGWE